MNSQEEANMFFKQKRDEYLIEIRKSKNSEFIQNKRMKLSQASFPKSANGFLLNDPNKVQTPMSELASDFIKAYNQGDLQRILLALVAIRVAVSQNTEAEPPIKELMQENITDELLNLLKPELSHEEEIISEVLFIAINIAYYDPAYSAVLVKFGLVPKSVEFLQHSNDTIRENAVWLLTNICADFLDERDNLLDLGIVKKIENMFDQSVMPESLQVNMLWFISNLCRGEPYPPFNKIEPLLKYVQFYLSSTNRDVLINCMWTLSYITQCPEESDERIEAVLNLGKTKEILGTLQIGDPALCAPTIRTIGNIINGDSSQVDRILEAGAIEALYPMLFDKINKIKQETCWAFSNLLAGTIQQLDKVLEYDNGNIIKRLLELSRTGTPTIQEECFFGLNNACEVADLEETATLVDFQILEYLMDQIKQAPHENKMETLLQTLKRILQKGHMIKQKDLGPEFNPYFQRILQFGGLYVLERGNFHKYNSDNITNLVEEILHAFNL